MKRNAKAVWNGPGAEGSGTLTTPSGALSEHPYSAKLRFQNEDGKAGTNPEELIAAAHAGCFSMALAFRLAANGTPADTLETEANLDDAKFQELAADAKANCPVSKLLAGAEISLSATLAK